MNFKKFWALLLALSMTVSLAACGDDTAQNTDSSESPSASDSADESETPSASQSANSSESPETSESPEASESPIVTDDPSVSQGVTDTPTEEEIADSKESASQVEGYDNEDIETDYSDRDLTGKEYSDKSTITLGSGDVTITKAGTYTLTGTLSDGQIIVDADSDNDKVQLILSNATITNSDGPAIYVKSADKVFITLADGTVNTLTDGSTYNVAGDENNPNACIFAQCDLTINGNGKLVVNGNYDHGVHTKDDLAVTAGTIVVTAVTDGLKGKDSVSIAGGTITITAGGDGIQSDHDSDDTKGWVAIDGGTIKITADGDGIVAYTSLQVAGGTITLKTGGGAANAEAHSSDMGMGGGMGRPGMGGSWGGGTSSSSDDGTSAKGLKAGVSLVIKGGTITADCCDDAIHCNGDIGIYAGIMTLASGDDGVHADDALVISGGGITITESYEGLEANSITISAGTIKLTASDDGINAAGGNDSSGQGGWFGGGDNFGGNSTAQVTISGGSLYIKASGDGIDANGTLTITGGYTVVVGPTSGDTATLDYDKTATISGGTFIGTGASMMAQTFSSSTNQGVVAVSMGGTIAAGTTVTLTDSSGNVVLTYAPELSFQVVILSSPDIVKGQSYTITVGSNSGTFTAS